MKLTKSQWIIVAVVAGVAIWYFFLRKKGETKESGYLERTPPRKFENKTDYLSGIMINYTGDDIDAGVVESGYDANEFPGMETGYFANEINGGTIESGYEKMRMAYPITKPTTLYNQGQMCRKDNQCQGGLKCMNGRCTPVRTFAPVKPPIKPIYTTTPITLSAAHGLEYSRELGYNTKAAVAMTKSDTYPKSTISTPKGGSLLNMGQMCRKDNQCAPGLRCVNGKCSK
jgi:hypothetical protein